MLGPGSVTFHLLLQVGYLEVVEALVYMPECDIDQINRNKHSALDEAICAWLLGAGSEGKQLSGRRYRILRCLLAEGAKHVTVTFLDMLIFSALNRYTLAKTKPYILSSFKAAK